MPRENPSDYQSIPDMGEPAVPGKHFYVKVAGKTNGAHQDFVKFLNGIGQCLVSSPEESDYFVVFCPITSRMGADTNVALDNIPDDKQAILVMMHHTFDREHVVLESRRLVNHPKVLLIVDCLFFESSLLKCNLNNIAKFEVKKFLGVSTSVPTWKDYIIERKKIILAGVCVTMAFVVIVAVVAVLNKK